LGKGTHVPHATGGRGGRSNSPTKTPGRDEAEVTQTTTHHVYSKYRGRPKILLKSKRATNSAQGELYKLSLKKKKGVCREG